MTNMKEPLSELLELITYLPNIDMDLTRQKYETSRIAHPVWLDQLVA